MKKFILNTFLILISFILSFELIANLSSKDNVLRVTTDTFSVSTSSINKNIKDDVYFLGDSYASTAYAKESYPILFRDYFKSRGYNFIDLTKSSTELVDHKIVLDSIGKLNPKFIIYFYNISDIISRTQNLPPITQKSVVKNDEKATETNKIHVKNIIKNSASLLFFKESIQYLSLTFTGKFYPGTTAYNFPKDNLKDKEYLKNYFNSINAENVFIFVNTPFTAGGSPKNWEQYQMFKEFSKDANYHLIQSVDIINDAKYAESFRNSHPNQEAIKIIASTLIKEFDKIK
ncbi:hypothetical protein [Polaribacter sargassicola]|uniref:hypothetical protein n=1 Tax=Polaribacter sargassicola TaxID=2836891 RepID=UPI001F4304BF|nr:hypothetical protein [Polaribacter sp. DS7-9]MCG1034794.1 hypothetical protein [Polaribacter sp. DS7-9]